MVWISKDIDALLPEGMAEAVKFWPTWFLRRAKVVAHYGFVPFVIAVGMLTTEPRPHILQLIGP